MSTYDQNEVINRLVERLGDGSMPLDDARELVRGFIAESVSESAEARSAEVYVLAMSVGPEAVSTDLELLQRTAEKKEEWAASEFEWRRDPYIGWTERLQLHYVSKSTGRWNKSGHYIDRVKVLEKAGQAQGAE